MGRPKARPKRETRVAIIGHPNVGKSTLLNVLTGSSRAIVSPIAGLRATRWMSSSKKMATPIVSSIPPESAAKARPNLMAEKLSVVMARKHLEAADVALLVIDAVEGVTSAGRHHWRLRA